MSSKELEIKLHDLKDMLRMAEELSGMIENAKDELKRQMEEQDVDTLSAGAYARTECVNIGVVAYNRNL